jgi:hypothetical protein
VLADVSRGLCGCARAIENVGGPRYGGALSPDDKTKRLPQMSEDERQLKINTLYCDDVWPEHDDEPVKRYGYCLSCGQLFRSGGVRITGTRAEVYEQLLPRFEAHTC